MKAWKRCACLERGTPTPVSATSTRQPHPAVVGLGRGTDGDHAALGELHGVRDQVGDDLRQPRRVARQHGRDVRVTRHHEVEPLLAGQLGEHGGHLLQQQPDVEVQPLQLQPAGLDLGEVEDVVDQPEQRPAGRLDTGRQPVLLGVERGAEQEVVEADHAVERRPDLVAHGGQEVRLLPRGLHRLVAGPGHLGLGPLALGDPGQLLGDPRGHGLDQLEAEQRGSGGDRDDGVDLGAEQDRERDGQPRLVPDRAAGVVGALGQRELRGGPRVAGVLVAVGVDRVERLDPPAAVRDGHEGPRPLPLVVQQHQRPGLHEHLAERGGLVGGAGDRLHEVVLGDLVLQGVLAGLQRGDQLVPLGVVGVAVQQGPRPARVVEQRGLAAQAPTGSCRRCAPTAPRPDARRAGPRGRPRGARGTAARPSSSRVSKTVSAASPSSGIRCSRAISGLA